MIIAQGGHQIAGRRSRPAAHRFRRISPQYRKAHKDTQMDLAAKLNYSDKSISKVGARRESARHLYPHASIADLYGITRQQRSSARKQPPKEDPGPGYHMFILLLSLALTIAVATLIFSLFVVSARSPYPAWLFFVYALPVRVDPLPSCSPASGGALLWQGDVRRRLLVWTLGLSPVSVAARTGKLDADLPRLRGAAGADASLGRLPQISAAQPRASGRGDEAGQPKRMTCSPASTRARTPKGRMQRGSA